MKNLIVLILFSIAGLSAYSQYNYDFNDNCREAYAEIISLKFEEGEKLIKLEKQLHPENNIPYLLENYIYFLKVFISEEEDMFDELEDKKDDIVDRLKDGTEQSPYYRYSLAQVYLQWAVARTKFKEYVSAALEINRAYRLLEKNKEEFPDFLPNNINLGLLHTMIGTIPDNYAWVKKIVGIEGTIDQGVEEILKVLEVSMTNEQFSHYKAECLFYMSFIQINLMSNKNKTFEYLAQIENEPKNLENPLAVYAISRIYMSNGNTDKAIEILTRRPRSSEYYPFHYLDYLTGLAKLHRLDIDAVAYFMQYVTNFKGVNFVKDAYQKMAWHFFVHDDTERYKEFIEKVKTHGNEIVDADKQAQREAERGILPNYHMLRARLLFDGGYYKEASDELTESDKSKVLITENDTLEYVYRLGRIHHEWGKKNDAIDYYKQTIVLGSESEYYYAANAALKLGMIYENQGKYDEAIEYYEAAQNMKNKEYKSSISQKAKAGINRIENR